MKHAAICILLGLTVLAVGCGKGKTDKPPAADPTPPAPAPQPEVTPPPVEPPPLPRTDIVYLGAPRDQAWFDAMFEYYCTRIAKIGDDFYDVGDDQIMPAPIKTAVPGNWFHLHDAVVDEVDDEAGERYEVTVNRHAYRTSDLEPIDNLPEEGGFDIIIDEAPENIMRGDPFDEQVVCTIARHFVIYQPLTREQFAEYLARDLPLIRYTMNEDDTIDKAYDE